VIVAVVMPLRLLGRAVVIALMITSSQLFAILGSIDGIRPVFLPILLFCSVPAALTRFLRFWHGSLSPFRVELDGTFIFLYFLMCGLANRSPDFGPGPFFVRVAVILA
jgi:hypothetical protein